MQDVNNKHFHEEFGLKALFVIQMCVYKYKYKYTYFNLKSEHFPWVWVWQSLWCLEQHEVEHEFISTDTLNKHHLFQAILSLHTSVCLQAYHSCVSDEERKERNEKKRKEKKRKEKKRKEGGSAVAHMLFMLYCWRAQAACSYGEFKAKTGALTAAELSAAFIEIKQE